MDELTGRPGYAFSKDRLARGWSYPLTRTLMDRALTAAKVTRVSHVSFLLDTRPLSHPHRPPVSVTYMGPAQRCMIEVRSVPSESRRVIADELAEVFDHVARWIADIDSQPPTWRSEWHQLHVVVADRGLRLVTELPPA